MTRSRALLELGEPARLDLGEVLGELVGDDPARRLVLGVRRATASARAASVAGTVGCGDAVEVGRRAGGRDGAEAVDVGVAEASGDGLAGRVGDLLDDADEQVRLLEGRRDEDGAAVEGAAEVADRLVHDGVVERVARSEQVGADSGRRAGRGRGRR